MYVNEEFKKLVIILNNRIKKQNDLQQAFEPHTKEYQASLKEEIKLLEEKKHLIDEETKRLDTEKKNYTGDFGSDKIKIPRLKSYEEMILEVLYGIKQELTEIKGYVKKEDKVTASDLFNDIQKGLIKKHQENMSKVDSSFKEMETIINKKLIEQDNKDIQKAIGEQWDKVKEYTVVSPDEFTGITTTYNENPTFTINVHLEGKKESVNDIFKAIEKKIKARGYK